MEKPDAEQVAWVFSKIVEMHKNGGGSYRKLIYDYMGFEPSDYRTLLKGMYITNALNDLHEYEEQCSCEDIGCKKIN